MAKLSVDQALMKAKSHLKKDEVIEAKELYHVILQAFPKKRLHQRITTSNKTRQNNFAQSPAQNAVIYNNIGNVLQDQCKLDKDIEAYNKVLSLKLDYADAYSNRLVT